ncbi:73d9a430-560a-4694-8551-4e78536fc376 [Thermothielavioides terrestris]|uniref:73d9a430-560a-4694-8551-4e78536fc376 n=1 Tax=Thermothielavioides terrestris TaxID=2587410 RepID=A0A3S4F030_9PEZI|nr:73d9a430-560a-4694-8551-4e78536fc376 [Thermothielavioides terrestris]
MSQCASPSAGLALPTSGMEIPGDLDEKLIWQYRNMLLMSVGPVLLRALA